MLVASEPSPSGFNDQFATNFFATRNATVFGKISGPIESDDIHIGTPFLLKKYP
jgi:hypothetical protein